MPVKCDQQAYPVQHDRTRGGCVPTPAVRGTPSGVFTGRLLDRFIRFVLG